MHFFETPRIVAEVLSPSTRSFDLIQKRAAYRAMPSVEAYVIVHSTHRRIEIDERRTGEWQTHVVDDGAAPVLGALVELDAIYARTDIV